MFKKINYSRLHKTLIININTGFVCLFMGSKFNLREYLMENCI